MIIFSEGICLLLVLFLAPGVFFNNLGYLFQLWYGLIPIGQFLLTSGGINDGLFETAVQILAAFLAIVFAISLFVIETSSEKYTQKIKKYFSEGILTKFTFGICLFTILASMLFLLFNWNNAYARLGIFFLLIMDSVFFYFYYQKMVEITNPYKIAELLEKESIKSINNKKSDDFEDIIATLADIIIKSIKSKDAALTMKYSYTFTSINYQIQRNCLNKKMREYAETILFKEGYRALRYAIDEKDNSRELLSQIIFDSIQLKASEKNILDEKGIELVLTSEFDSCRYIIERDDFELFQNNIHHVSLLPVNNPQFIQNKICADLYRQISTDFFVVDQEISDKIFREIACFNFLLQYFTIKDFASVKIIQEAYKVYKKQLVKNLDKIFQSEEKIENLAVLYQLDKGEIVEKLRLTRNKLNDEKEFHFLGIYKQLDVLLISLKLHFTFYQIGAFIIFEGMQKQINSAKYLKELWSYTKPEDADGTNLNETPILFDPVWLSYLHLYGGRNVEYWTKTIFGISLNFDDYHGAEKYLYQYYLLTLTQCLKIGKSDLHLLPFEELDHLKQQEPHKLIEFYNFIDLFRKETPELISYIDELIAEAQRWDLLFDNEAEVDFKYTKLWVNVYFIACEKLMKEIIRRLNPDQKKIEYFTKKVIEEYHRTNITNDLAEIHHFNQETDINFDYIKICHNIGNLPKEWFLPDNDSHADHIFMEFGHNISRGETQHILEKILSENVVESLNTPDSGIRSIFENLKNCIYNMKLREQSPSVVFIPLEIMTKFVLERISLNYQTLQIDDETNLKVITSNNRWSFEEIVILDKSAGIWTFKPVNDSGERLFVEISPNETDDSVLKILICTTINYKIVKPDAVKILKIKREG